MSKRTFLFQSDIFSFFISKKHKNIDNLILLCYNIFEAKENDKTLNNEMRKNKMEEILWQF